MKNQNSRIITHPDTVEKENRTVLIVDATRDEVENVALFCQVSKLNYDIYLYHREIDDVKWLSKVLSHCDIILVAQNSPILVVNDSRKVTFGKDELFATPLTYFQDIDDK